MSQSSLLTEDEIRSYLHESFGLNLAKEALLKPSREVVTEIYSRFLDDTHFKWRPSGDEPKYGIMVARLKFIMSRYNISFNFQRSDLLMPTRKRTTAFLNVLIYIKAQFEALAQEYEEIYNEKALEKEENGKLKRELANSRSEVEDLAYKKAAKSKSKKEILDDMNSIRRQFEESDLLGEELATEAKNQKNETNLDQVKLQKLQAELEMVCKQRDDDEKRVTLLNTGKSRKRSNADFEAKLEELTKQLTALQKECAENKETIKKTSRLSVALSSIPDSFDFDLVPKYHQRTREEPERIESRCDHVIAADAKLSAEVRQLRETMSSLADTKNRVESQNRIKLYKRQSELEEAIELRKDYVKTETAKIDALKENSTRLTKEYDDILKGKSENEIKFRNYEEILNRKMDMFVKRQRENERICLNFSQALSNYQTRMDNFLGKSVIDKNITTTSTIKEVPADRTYIKESAVRLTN